MEKKYRLNSLAASELVGTLILSALIVLVIGIVAVTLLSQGPPVEVPALRVDIHNDSGALVLINRGGDTLFREKTRIFVDGVDRTDDFTLDGESWVEYGAGDWLLLPGMFRDDVSVQIVHTGPEVPALLFTIGDIGVPPGPGPDTYQLTLVASPAGAGTLTGGGSYEAGAGVPVNAVAQPGWTFSNWTRNGVLVSASPGFTYTMLAESVTLVANFEIDPTMKYNLTLVADPVSGGTVNGSGFYEAGEVVPISAQPNAGYLFINWTQNGVEISNTSAFNFTMPAGDVTLVANFEPPGVSGFTAEAWVRWNRNPTPDNNDQRWATIVIDGDADGNSRYHFQHDQQNTRFEFAIRTANNVRTFRQGTTTPLEGVWYYVVGVYNEETGHLRIYVNGIEENSASVSTLGLIPSPGRYQVGGPAGIEWPGPTSMQRKFNGNILCLGTHERAFTPQEILDKYNAGCPPVVDFTANVTTGETPLAVQFTDLTTHSPTAWAWDFGDGGTSTLQNPTHTYLAAGTYTVSLTATNAQGSNTVTKTNYITVSEPGAPPEADFTGTPTSGTAPLGVQFTDTSTGSPTSWSWSFGDGNTSIEQNPTHVYSAAGTYNVSLEATNAQGSDTETKTGYITVSDIPEVGSIEYQSHTTSSITFLVRDSNGDPYDGTVPGAISLRERPGNALVNQGVVITADAVWSPNINSNGIATLTYTNRNFAGVGTATVSPIIIESTDETKEIRLQIQLQLNNDRIQNVVVIG